MGRRLTGLLFCLLFTFLLITAFVGTKNYRNDLILWYKGRDFNDTNQWHSFYFWQKLTLETRLPQMLSTFLSQTGRTGDGETGLDIKSWDKELDGIVRERTALIWKRRHPTAFWRGNTDTGGNLRKDLQRCSAEVYGNEIIHQNWNGENNVRSEDSRLAQQCKHRYKIYVEGWGWSVSLKYILACDSPVLLVNPKFYDFFSRGLIPMKHFWPIRTNKLCSSIKFALDWGNNNTKEAQAMGKAGNEFIMKEVSMKHVYDYMLRSLLEYAKLLQYEPTPGDLAKEMCAEAFLCQAPHKEKPVYEDSMVRSPSNSSPCFLPTRDKKIINTSLVLY